VRATGVAPPQALPPAPVLEVVEEDAVPPAPPPLVVLPPVLLALPPAPPPLVVLPPVLLVLPPVLLVLPPVLELDLPPVLELDLPPLPPVAPPLLLPHAISPSVERLRTQIQVTRRMSSPFRIEKELTKLQLHRSRPTRMRQGSCASRPKRLNGLRSKLRTWFRLGKDGSGYRRHSSAL